MANKRTSTLSPADGAPVLANQPSAWPAVAVGLLAVIAASVAFTLVNNADVLWQLSSGRWMLQHKSLLDFDPFSVDPESQWINIHWLFQVIIAFLHAAGGFALLTVSKAALTAGAMVVFASSLRKHVPAPWLIFSGLAMLVIVAARLRVRPEIFSIAFIISIICILDNARRGGPTRKLWLLVPIMLVWVNMHGLYIIGLGLVWSSVAGDWIDAKLKRNASSTGLLSKQAMLPLVTATVAVLISPWPIDSVIHPLLLWGRISGQAIYYTYGVSELRPSWQSPGQHVEVIGLILLALGLMIANFRKLPLAHIVWLTAMVALAAMARRNIALAGPIVAYMLAWHGSAGISRLFRTTGKMPRLSWLLNTCMVVIAVVITASACTSELWRRLGWNRRFGAGLQTEKYPIATAQFLRTMAGGGDIFCENFGDASTFIYASHPEHRVYMDGRLEAHSQARFVDQHNIATAMRTEKSAQNVKLPESIRFVFVSDKMPEPLAALSQSSRFRLCHLDLAGACFIHLAWQGNSSDSPDFDFTQWEFDLEPSGICPVSEPARTFWAQNPPPATHRFGAMLLSLGQRSAYRRGLITKDQQRCITLAVRYLEAARLRRQLGSDTLRGTLAQAYQQKAMQTDINPSPAVPIDVSLARALHIYRQMDLTHLGSQESLMFAQQQILAMQQARQIDAATRVAKTFLNRLPSEQRVRPPRVYLQLRDTLEEALEFSQVQATGIDDQLPIEQQARLLTTRSIGLIELATSRLRSLAPGNPRALTLLGDLLLRQGMVREAQAAYAEASQAGADKSTVALREALCLWVNGEFFEAESRLSQLAEATDDPLTDYYLASLLEQLGKYGRAASAIASTSGQNAQLQSQIENLEASLPKE